MLAVAELRDSRFAVQSVLLSSFRSAEFWNVLCGGAPYRMIPTLLMKSPRLMKKMGLMRKKTRRLMQD